jgi:hypothetical protein
LWHKRIKGGAVTDEERREEEQGTESPEQAEGTTAQQVEKSEDPDEAKQKMAELEEQDEPPKDLEDWPADEAKYETYGGPEGGHSYEEGPERKLGPSSLRHHEGGEVSIEGEKVDDPERYKGEPVPGGPTDESAADLPGEKSAKKRKEKEKEESGGED